MFRGFTPVRSAANLLHLKSFNFNCTFWRRTEKIERWRRDYNCNRPHSSLGDRTPEEFASILGCRPFALPIVGKAVPPPSQGFADAGRKAPALDRVSELPCKTEIRAKGLPERPRSRVSFA